MHYTHVSLSTVSEINSQVRNLKKKNNFLNLCKTLNINNQYTTIHPQDQLVYEFFFSQTVLAPH